MRCYVAVGLLTHTWLAYKSWVFTQDWANGDNWKREGGRERRKHAMFEEQFTVWARWNLGAVYHPFLSVFSNTFLCLFCYPSLSLRFYLSPATLHFLFVQFLYSTVSAFPGSRPAAVTLLPILSFPDIIHVQPFIISCSCLASPMTWSPMMCMQLC